MHSSLLCRPGLWMSVIREVEPVMPSTSSRLKKAYNDKLLSFEEHLRAGAPSEMVSIKSVKKLGPAAGVVPGSHHGETPAKVLGCESCQ